jgi:hypothetical protein
MAEVVPPRGVPKYECVQPKLDVLPRVPLRMIVAGPSGAGKSVFLSAAITDLYKGVFKRVYIFSPNVHVDGIWHPVKAYIKKVLEVPDDEQVYFDTYDPRALEEIIETQKAVIDLAKRKKFKKMPSILVVIDDMADNPAIMRSDKLLHSLFTRGRHHFTSTIVSTQKFRALATICRVNCQALIVFRLRSAAELEAIVEEVSAVYDKKTVVEIYHEATKEPFSFLYVDLTAKTPETTFMLRFQEYLTP